MSSHMAKRMLLIIGIGSLVNLLGYLYFKSIPVYPLKIAVNESVRQYPIIMDYAQIDRGNITRTHSVQRKVLQTKSVAEKTPTRHSTSDFYKGNVSKSANPTGLEGVFQNFSISFDDLRHGQKLPSKNNDNVKFQKFVVTLQTTKVSTLSNANLSSIATTATPVMRPPNPHPYDYVINQPAVCSDNTTELFFVIVVCSGLNNTIARMAIRKTWGSKSQLARFQARLVFLVGVSNSPQLQWKIQNESNVFHDIVQENFMDTYKNLSLKSVAMLKWVSTYCSMSKFVLKSDDDMFINLKVLHGTLFKTKAERTLMGQVIVGAKPLRKNSSKWYTPEEDFPDRVYPKYFSGTGYVISTDIVQQLYNVTLNTPLFWLEDIYITGICASKLRPRYLSVRGFSYLSRTPTGCAYQNIISGHKVLPRDMFKIWKELQNPNLKCPKNRSLPVKRKLSPVLVRKVSAQKNQSVPKKH